MLDADVIAKIMHDITSGVPPEDSTAEYDAEMLEFRNKVKSEYENYLDAHPDAELYVPEDLPSADIPVDDED